MKKSFTELQQQGLHWVQSSSWKQNYELRSENDEVIATMKRTSSWNSRAEVDAPGNQWTFDRKGILRQRIIIQSTATGDEPAKYTSKGRLEYPDGRVYLWKQGNFWGTKWVWTTEDGEPVLGFQTSGFLKTEGEIDLNADLASAKVPSLLIFLGWYLYTLYQDDSTTAVIVATSV